MLNYRNTSDLHRTDSKSWSKIGHRINASQDLAMNIGTECNRIGRLISTETWPSHYLTRLHWSVIPYLSFLISGSTPRLATLPNVHRENYGYSTLFIRFVGLIPLPTIKCVPVIHWIFSWELILFTFKFRRASGEWIQDIHLASLQHFDTSTLNISSGLCVPISS